MIAHTLELDRDEIEQLGGAALEFVAEYLDQLPTEPITNYDVPPSLVDTLLEPPPEKPRKLDDLLASIAEAAQYGLNTASGRNFAYFPSGGLTSSAVGELMAQTLNRFTAFAEVAPGLVAMEHSVVRWLCAEMGLPDGSGGLVVSGGSMATLPAMVAARDDRLDGDIRDSVIYVSEHTHYAVAKAAHIAGLGDVQTRVVPNRDLRMDVAAAERMIAADREQGLRPFMLVATAGATSTGLIDPLDRLGLLARREGLWFHVDGAYGALYRLTDHGHAVLAGIEYADSIVADPHKSLFLPYGTGILLVRDEQTLRAPHAMAGHYIQDIGRDQPLPDYAALGPELTREWRGLRLWLPLHLHGVAAFRGALTEKINLARRMHQALAMEPALELPWVPDLTVVGFRLRGDGPACAEANRRLLDSLNESQQVFLSSTQVDGKYTLRLCPQGLRTHEEEVGTAIDLIRSAVRAARY
jgi:aromatic-L-amino-acid decarboxylase